MPRRLSTGSADIGNLTLDLHSTHVAPPEAVSNRPQSPLLHQTPSPPYFRAHHQISTFGEADQAYRQIANSAQDFSSDPEVRKRYQHIHRLIVDICQKAQRGSQGNLRNDQGLLKRWVDDLLSVIEPQNHPSMCYEPDVDGELDEYLQIGSGLEVMKGKADKMIVPVVAGWLKRPTGERKIDGAYTVNWLIHYAGLGESAQRRLAQYRLGQRQHSLGSNESRRMSHRMAQISQTPILGRASEANGGLLF